MVYDKPIKITKKTENEFSVSIVLADNTIISKILSKNQLQQMYVDIEELLKEI
jgi:hypothetical protein